MVQSNWFKFNSHLPISHSLLHEMLSYILFKTFCRLKRPSVAKQERLVAWTVVLPTETAFRRIGILKMFQTPFNLV